MRLMRYYIEFESVSKHFGITAIDRWVEDYTDRFDAAKKRIIDAEVFFTRNYTGSSILRAVLYKGDREKLISIRIGHIQEEENGTG